VTRIWTALSICRLSIVSKVIEFNRNRLHWSGLQTFTEAGAVVQRCRGVVVQRCRGVVVQRCRCAEVQRCRGAVVSVMLGEWDI